MITLLAGTPDANGSWSVLGGGPHSDQYDPAVDASNTYVYTVPGLPPCADATAYLQVTEVPQALAGGSGALTVCVDADEVDLFDGLLPPFDGTGTWTNDSGGRCPGRS
jgi:hypothetical protein